MSATHSSRAAPLLDPRERHFRVPSQHPGLSLFLSHLPPTGTPNGRAVIYVHGGTFPSALSIAYRFDGRSWRDELCSAGYDVWGLDFLGFGASDRYPEMDIAPEGKPALCPTADAAEQLAAAIHFICDRQPMARLSIIAHSWGTLVAGRFAGLHPDRVDRMVFFGPIARREGPPAERLGAWRYISLQDQWDRFTGDVPEGEEPVLSRLHFDTWGERYLDSDPASRGRAPASVQVPAGPFQDIFDAFTGRFPYDPGAVKAPVAIIRGEWDSLCTDTDAGWLFTHVSPAAPRRDVKIARATHLMHLEQARHALYRETEAFLAGNDTVRVGE